MHITSAHKKIKRKYFKHDVVVKAYKCNLNDSSGIAAVKVYISNHAFYIVQRPDRKKLITLKFTQISNLIQNNSKGLDIILTNDKTYSLTNFKRPDAALGFLLNFWGLVSKDKLFPDSDQRYLNSTKGISSGGESCIESTTSLSPIAGGTPSREINASTSSTSCGRSTNATTQSSSESDQVEEEVEVSLSCLNHNDTQSGRTSKDSKDSAEFNADVPNRHKDTNFDPSSTHTASPTDTTDSAQHSQNSSPNRRTIGLYQQSSSIQGRSLAALQSSNLAHARRPPVGATGPGFLWLLNILLYPISSPPVKFTPILAFVILMFLLLSTLHLYHRLVVFDLNTPTALPMSLSSRSAETCKSSHTNDAFQSSMGTLSRQMHQLEEQISVLTGMIEQFTKALGSVSYKGSDCQVAP